VPVGGPWRARGYDPMAWRPPKSPSGAVTHPGSPDSSPDRLTAIVWAYVASVVTSIAIMVTLLKAGW
jgi:hypothetical protein